MIEKRQISWLSTIFLVFSATVVLSIFVGSGIDGASREVIVELRLPRTAYCMIAGIALGAAAALLKGLLGNPIADPGLLGVASTAASAQVAIATLSITVIPFAGGVAAIAAGAVVCVLLLALLSKLTNTIVGHLPPVLIGFGLTFAMMAVTAGVAMADSAAAAQTIRLWSVASAAHARQWPLEAAAIVLLVLLLTLWKGRGLELLELGDELAESAGVRVRVFRLGLYCAIAILVASATWLIGPIFFAGLAAVTLADRVAQGNIHLRIILSSLVAAALILGADVLGRVIMRPDEVAVGVLTAILGCPALLLLVRSRATVRP